jgi:hypothetical protein
MTKPDARASRENSLYQLHPGIGRRPSQRAMNGAAGQPGRVPADESFDASDPIVGRRLGRDRLSDLCKLRHRTRELIESLTTRLHPSALWRSNNTALSGLTGSGSSARIALSRMR